MQLQNAILDAAHKYISRKKSYTRLHTMSQAFHKATIYHMFRVLLRIIRETSQCLRDKREKDNMESVSTMNQQIENFNLKHRTEIITISKSI